MEKAEEKAHNRSKRRDKKNQTKMKVSGKGMKRFAGKKNTPGTTR